MSDFNWGSDDSTNFNVTPTPEKKPNQALTFVIAGVIALVMGLVGGVAGSKFFGSTTAAPSASSDASLFSQPADVEGLVNTVRKATVTVWCKDGSGSGWGIDLKDDPNTTKDDAYPYEIVTNFHVIESCVDGGDITFNFAGESTMHDAVLFSYDNSAYTAGLSGDLAIIMTATKVPFLPVANAQPKIGDWAMAVGSPGSAGFTSTDRMDGNTTFGRVTNFIPEHSIVVTDAAVNHGNSGGPLVNSHGEVMATNTWILATEDASGIAYSIGIPTICEKLLDCAKDSALLWNK